MTEFQDASSDQARAHSWVGEPPSSHLSLAEWQAISKSLQLSRRQLQIARGVFDGLDEALIGQALGLSPHTVHAHFNRLYRKLEVKSRCELIVRVFLAYLSLASSTEGRAISELAHHHTGET